MQLLALTSAINATISCVHASQVLRYACDPAGPEALNLLEDGMATWLTALRVAPAAEPRLTDLFPLLAAAMHASTGASFTINRMYALG
jgi:hypothetical protein